MMHTKKIKSLIKNDIAPKLRAENWRGSGFHFRRENDNQTIDLLSVQMSRGGRSFCIEAGVYFMFIEWPFVTDLKKVKTYDSDIRKRLTPNRESDYWWEYSIAERRLINHILKTYQTSAKPFFEYFYNWKDNLTKITTDDIVKGNLDKAFPLDTRTALFLAKIHFELGNLSEVIEFSEFGLSTISGNVGSALIPEFEKFIELSDKES